MGRASALAFGKAGAKLILVDITEAGLKQTVEELGPNVAAVKTFVMDISDDEKVIALIRGIPSMPEFGRLDYALNCAGVLGKVRVSRVLHFPDLTATYKALFAGPFCRQRPERR